jgi:hypothetical protein
VLGRLLELYAIRSDGSEFECELTITEIPAEGPPQFTGIIRDISERDQPQFLVPPKSREFGSYHSPKGIAGIRRIPANGEFQGCCVA